MNHSVIAAERRPQPVNMLRHLLSLRSYCLRRFENLNETVYFRICKKHACRTSTGFDRRQKCIAERYCEAHRYIKGSHIREQIVLNQEHAVVQDLSWYCRSNRPDGHHGFGGLQMLKAAFKRSNEVSRHLKSRQGRSVAIPFAQCLPMRTLRAILRLSLSPLVGFRRLDLKPFARLALLQIEPFARFTIFGLLRAMLLDCQRRRSKANDPGACAGEPISGVLLGYQWVEVSHMHCANRYAAEQADAGGHKGVSSMIHGLAIRSRASRFYREDVWPYAQ